QVLHGVTSPEVALALLLIGIFGLIFEAYNPGIGLDAIIGVVALGLALYGLDALPTNWWGVLVIVAGIAALIYDVHVAGFGAGTIAGLAAVGLGARFLFPNEAAAVSLTWWGIAAALLGTFVFFISVMTAALRVRLRRPVSDDDALIGTIGEAQTDIAPEGTVLTKGTVWRARTMETGIAAGQKVKVMASEGFVLLVEPVDHDG
ncbi:MAG TPA: NfeD family protein, partial [Actinomycetota bacterium]|nr:NfeD family protein [Actinomycetota bacterium]